MSRNANMRRDDRIRKADRALWLHQNVVGTARLPRQFKVFELSSSKQHDDLRWSTTNYCPRTRPGNPRHTRGRSRPEKS